MEFYIALLLALKFHRHFYFIFQGHEIDSVNHVKITAKQKALKCLFFLLIKIDSSIAIFIFKGWGMYVFKIRGEG